MNRPSETASFASRRYRLLVAAVLLLGIGLRLAVWADRVAHDPGFDSPALDSRVYLNWAREIADGNILGDRPFFLNPLYAYFLAPIVRWAGDHALAAVRLIQTVLGLATILLVAGATRRLLGPAIALVATLLAAACPLLPFYEQVVMIVSVAIFLNALLLYLLARFADQPRPRTAVLAGLVLGLAILARPNVGLFALALPLWFLVLAPAGGRLRWAARQTLIVAAASIAVVIPVTVRNYAVGHDLVLVTSSAGVNLYQANNPIARERGYMFSDAVRGNPLLIENDAKLVAEREEGRELRPSEVSSYWTRRSLREAADSPGAALGFLGRKFLFFLWGQEIPSSYNFAAEGGIVASLGWNPLTFTILSPLALLGMWFVLRERRRAAPFLLLYLAYALGLTVFFPLGHYRAPVLPAAIPLAAAGLLGGVRRIRGGTPDQRLGLAGLVLLAIVVTNLPGLVRFAGLGRWTNSSEARVAWFYNRGLYAVRRGDYDRAERAFENARREDPGSPLPDLGMADLEMARGDVLAERRHLERALEKQPGDPPVLARYGLALFKMGRETDGLARAEKAAELGPMDWVVFSVLGEMYEELDRPEDGLRAYEHAVDCGLAENEVLAGMSRCLRELGRNEEALRRLDRGIERLPDDAELRLERAAAAILVPGVEPGPVRRDVEVARRAGLEIPAELEAWVRDHPAGE